MTKRVVLAPELPRIAVDYAGYVRLGAFWDHRRLTGPFWRFYHHDGPGAGLYTQEGKLELRPGRCYILPPHCNRLTWCTGDPFQLYIHFELSMNIGSARSLFPEVELTAEMRLALDELRSSLIRNGPGGLRHTLLALTLCSRALTLLPREALLESTTDRRLADTCNYLLNHLDSEVNLKTMAARVHLNPNSFSRLFREKTGVTPYRYLLQLRYSQAAKLLRANRYSIDEICELVGVKDRFHFSRTFKKFHGIPPARYRRNYSMENFTRR